MIIKKSRLMQIIQEEISRLNEADKYADLNLDALALAAKEDPDAMGPFLERFQETFKQFARKKSNYNEADAEDLLQDISLKMLSQLSNFKGESKFETWVYRILSNKSTDEVRKKGRESLFAGSGAKGETIGDISDASQSAQEYEGTSPFMRPPVAYIRTPEEELLRKERLAAFEVLRKAINNGEIKLNDKQKAVMLNQLSDEPKSGKELAKELGLSGENRPGTISSQYREKIKKWLEKKNIDDAESQNILNSLFSGGIAPGALKEADLPTNKIQKEELSLEQLIAEVLSELI